nr:PREDICTED: uncharacterized protein LOC103280707 [Anolis carolinensis]|eukprot:XP_008118830.1 PREDICTED: uncharacterized protein LOC103280707 [Anolis carolinensis]
MFLQNPKRSQNFPAILTQAEPNRPGLSSSPDRGGRELQGPMMEAGKSGPVRSSSWPQDQPGTSSEALEEARQAPAASQQSSQGSLAPLPKKRSYSTEMFSMWRDIRWFQIPLSSLRRPKAGLFSFTFQSSLQEYQQVRKSKRLKVGRPFSVLPLPGLPSTLDDCPREAPHKRNDSRRCLRAGKARGRKSLSSLKKGHQASGGLNTRLQKCLTATHIMPKSYIFCSKAPQGEKKESSGCSGKKWRKGLALKAQSLPSRSPSACSTAETDGSSDQFGIWDGTRSQLEEDDGFPPDWSPPRIDFMYENPPPLSPAPGPLSASQSSGEMPDITKGLDKLPPRECATVASSPTESHLLFLEESVDMEDVVHESEEVGSPDRPLSNLCPEGNEEQEGNMFEDQSPANDQMALDLEDHPSLLSPIHPLPIVHVRSSISTTLEEFSGAPKGLVYESDAVEEESGPEYPTAFIPVTLSRMSCEGSASASMDELSGGSEGSDVEEDNDDGDLLPLEELLWTSNTNSSAVKTKTTVTG